MTPVSKKSDSITDNSTHLEEQNTHNLRVIHLNQINKNNQSNDSVLSMPDYKDIFSWISSHKVAVFSVATVAAFVGMQSYITSLEHSIRSHTWSNWKKEVPTHKLYTLSDVVIQQELLGTIKRKYSYSKDDYADSFLTFLDAIKEEEQQLNGYRHIIAFITWLKLSGFFKYDDKLLEECSVKIDRITYLRDRLINTFIK